VAHYPLSELCYFFFLLGQFEHDVIPFLWIVSVIPVIGNPFKQKPISRRQRHIHNIIFKGVLEKPFIHVSMHNLDYDTNHLPDLIVEERLPFEVKMNEFKSLRIG